jgi:hypothetical protein
VRELAAEQAATAGQLAQAGQAAAEQLAAAQALTATATEAATLLDAAARRISSAAIAGPAAAATSTTAAPRTVYTDPIDGSTLEAPPRSPAPSAGIGTRSTAGQTTSAAQAPSLFGSDLDDQPLFSDNANDLLDGVLDDVLGNLTDEGSSSP